MTDAQTVYLLCEWGGDYKDWSAIGWSFDKEKIEAEAMRRCWEQYRQDKAENDASTDPYKPAILSPHETDYRQFFVTEVARMELP